MRRVWIGTVILVTLVLLRLSHAAAFSCAAGDVTCLRAAIHAAHTNGAAQTLTLEAGTYTITAVDNLTDGANGLPSIHGTFTIRSAAPPGPEKTGLFCWITVVVLWTERRRTRLTIVLVAALLMVAIGVSRLYLGVYYFSDGVAGYAAGLLWLSACITGLEMARRQRGAVPSWDENR